MIEEPLRVIRDADARAVIRQQLDRNIVVLAGAGAGKTTELVYRMIAAISSGRSEPRQMAAITFTRKAAGELRVRLTDELEQAVANASGIEHVRLTAAVRSINQLFVGTIHSFCARIIRERPIEAGLPPDFREIEEREELRYRRLAWDEFIDSRFREADERLFDLQDLGLRTENLYSFFQKLNEFTDLPLLNPDVDPPDLEEAVARIQPFLDEMRKEAARADPGDEDDAMNRLRKTENYRRYHGLREAKDYAQYLEKIVFTLGKKPTQRDWPDRKRAKNFGIEAKQYADIAQTALAAWREFVYGKVASIVQDAVAFYEERRRKDGLVSFQDLLMQCAALLRENPEVREHIHGKYRSLFVDEFQDTDPIQAEIVVLVTADGDFEEEDWRKLTPEPGSLFIVGDEKQSIYRFRRADLDTFRQVRSQIKKAGGEEVILTTTFRAVDNLCEWLNGSLQDIFPPEDDYQAAFSPLHHYHETVGDDRCVRSLSVAQIKGHPAKEIAHREALRIASFIRAAMIGETPLNEGDDSLLGETSEAGDFMILTATKHRQAVFAAALESFNIPYDITGGDLLRDSLEVNALVSLLESVHQRENKVALIGYLRGALIGLSDADLYALKTAGQTFNYRAPVSRALSAELRGRVKKAFDDLAFAEDLLNELPAAAAVRRIVDHTGLMAFAAGQLRGSTRAGNLVRLIELIAEMEQDGLHWGRIVEELRALLTRGEGFEMTQMTLDVGRDDVVQIMNIHQAKGLQSKVVFLADSGDSRRRRDPDYHFARREDDGFIAVPITVPWGFNSKVVAQPQGWEKYMEIEEKYLAAERNRLVYVAATRAERLLVVCRYPYDEGDSPDLATRGPWGILNAHLAGVPELERPTTVPKPLERLPMQDPDRLATRARGIIARAAEPSFALTSVTAEGVDDEDVRIRDALVREEPGLGTDYGVEMHRVLEAIVNGGLRAEIDGYVRHRFDTSGLRGNVEQALTSIELFRTSELFREIRGSDRVYTEVPFLSADPDDERRLYRGFIDLVFRTAAGWKIVDYKTDVNIERRLSHYERQVTAYANFWQELTGEEVVEMGLWLVGEGRFVGMGGG